MAFINSSFQEINKVWLQVRLQTNTTTSSKKINMTMCPFAFGLLRLYVFSFTFPFFFQSLLILTAPFMHMDLLCNRQNALFTGPTTTLFKKKYIKNGYRGTIHSFKNYLATVFSVFSFQQNKLHPNGPYIFRKSNH